MTEPQPQPQPLPEAHATPGEAGGPIRGIDSLSAAEARRKTLAVLDPGGDAQAYAECLRRLDAALDAPALILVPNKNQEKVLVAALGGLGLDVAGRTVQFKAVNARIDDGLYGRALPLAHAVCEALQGALQQGLGSLGRPFDPPLLRPLAINLHDRFVAQMRPALEVQEACAAHGIAQVVHFARPTRLSRAFSETLANLLPGVITTHDHLPPRVRERFGGFRSSTDFPDIQTLHPLPAFGDAAATGDFVVGTNLRARQNRDTAMPVVMELLGRGTVTVMDNTDAGVSEVLGGYDVFSAPGADGLQFLAKSRRGEAVPLAQSDARLRQRVVEAFAASVASGPDSGPDGSPDSGSDAAFLPVLVAYLRDHLLPLVHHVADLAASLAPHVRRARRVVVSPGRTLESGVLVALARMDNTPSLDIQTGTVSRQRRFTTPLADYMLVMEPYSKDLYHHYLGFPEARITVVGAPKLEHDVGPMRGADRARLLADRGARLGLDSDRPTILFASQPVGNREMSAVLEVVLGGLARAGVDAQVLVKPHPGENAIYTSAYRALAAQYGRPLVIDRGLTSLEAITLSDLVVTYFSTVGLEAFALGRPVIAVNPFGVPAPYGLAELGVAMEAKDPEVFAFLVKSWSEGGWPETAAGRGLDCLRDGQTLPRTVDFITDPRLSVRRDDAGGQEAERPPAQMALNSAPASRNPVP